MTPFAAPIAEQIWDMKYRFKKPDGTPIDETVEDTWNRIATALAVPEREEIREQCQRDFYYALKDFKFLPAGRVVAGAGTGRAVTLFNCYVMGTIPDSMSGIFSMLREAALTMQQGGGIGYDFSTIRPKTSLVKKLGADASGPLSFMDCWDAMCRTVMSAGSRRGAMMATLRCDHPDIMDFITAKKDPNRLRMFNLSVLVTDAFMEAVKNDTAIPLLHVEPPKDNSDREKVVRPDGVEEYVHDYVAARDLWEAIMDCTYNQAEPGVIFIDRINKKNNLWYVETISSTNPCGEQPLPPYGACLLGSVNLVKFIKNAFHQNAEVDYGKLRQVVRIAIRMLDNVIDVSNFPLPQQEAEAKAKRRIGLGLTGLADALAMLQIVYGSPAAERKAAEIMSVIDNEAYLTSVGLAVEKGAFPLYKQEYLQDGTYASMQREGVRNLIGKHGIRNALLTSIAPTGTISLYAGNVSSGIEPIFAYGYTRKVLQPDGSKTEERVEDYAVALYRKMYENGWLPRQNRVAPAMAFDPEKHLPDYFVSAQTLSPEAHVKMQAAAQRHVDSSISKTINCPEDISFEDFKNVYLQAYESGCKGCTTYRPNEITGSVLSVEEKAPPPENKAVAIEGTLNDEVLRAMLEAPEEPLAARPEELKGSTYKIKVGDQKAVYLTINDVVESDGTIRPFEIFMRSSDPTHDEWMVAVSRLVSAIMRRPYDSSFVGKDLMRIASAVSGGFQRGYGYRPSLVAAIGAQIKAHCERVASTARKEHVGTDVTPHIDDWIPEFPDPSPMALQVTGRTCKECGGFNFKHESGCTTCTDCGWSSCS